MENHTYTHEQLLAIVQACFKTQTIAFDDYLLVILKKKSAPVEEVIQKEIEKADE